MGETPRSGDAEVGRAREQKPPMPRWVKVFGIIALVVVLLVVVLTIAGGGRHGPGRHLPGGDSPAGHERPAQHAP